MSVTIRIDPSIEPRLNAIKAMPVPMPEQERQKYGVKDLRAGSYFRIKDGIQDRTFQVLDFYRYAEAEKKGGEWREEKNADLWFELKVLCLNNGREMFVEMEEDDELLVFMGVKSIKMRALQVMGKNTVGLTEEDLDRFEEEDEGKIKYEGEVFEYEDDGDGLFFKEGKDGIHFFYYDFENEKGDRVIGVEGWGDEENPDYEVSLGQKVNPKTIEVLVDGGAN
jgi:hypothetical protein